MAEVAFYSMDEVPDSLLRFAVVVAFHEGKFVLVRHRCRTTWECPGGKREQGETIIETARRELYEETGANDAFLVPVCVYKLNDYGMVFRTEIERLGAIPAESEIGEVCFFDTLPPHSSLTYPSVHPRLVEQALSFGGDASERAIRKGCWDADC